MKLVEVGTLVLVAVPLYCEPAAPEMAMLCPVEKPCAEEVVAVTAATPELFGAVRVSEMMLMAFWIRVAV